MFRKLLALSTALLLFSAAEAAPLDDARSLIDSGQWHKAEVTLRGVLQEDPTATQARLLLAEIFLLRRNGAGAEAELERAIKQGVPRDEVLVPLARALIFQGKGERVLELIGPPEKLPAPGKGERLALRGLAELSLDELSNAERDLNQAIELSPDVTLAYLGLARIAASEQDWDHSIELVNKALDKDPKSLEGWELLAGMNIAVQDTDAALAALNKAINLAGQSFPSRLLRAQLLLDRGEADAAEKDINALGHLAPNHPGLVILKGRLALARGQFEDGIAAIERYLEVAPRNALALYLASAAHYRQGRMKPALEYAERLHEVSPDSAQANALLAGILLAKQDVKRADKLLSALPPDTGLPLVDELQIRVAVATGRLDEALEILARRIDRAAPEDAKRWNDRSIRLRILAAKGDWKPAIEEAEAMLAERPDDPLPANLLMEAKLRSGDTNGAVEMARARAAANPKDPATLSALAKVQARSGDIDGARATFKQALEIDPQYGDAALSLARLEAGSGHLDAAREPLQQLVETRPDALAAVLGLASLDLKEGRIQDADSRLTAALERDPKNLRLRLNLAAARIQSGDKAGALRALQDAPAEQSDSQVLLSARGKLELETGQPAMAVESFEQLRELRPESAEPLYLLGLARAETGQLAGIEDLMEDALVLDEDTPLAARTLASIYQKLPDTPTRERFLASIERVAPSNVAYHLLATDLALEQQDKAGAIDHLRAAHTSAPNNWPILQRLVGLLASDERYDQAWQLLSVFVQDYPDATAPRLLLGTLELQRGENERAIEQYRRLLELDRKQPQALNNLAMLTMDEDLDGALKLAREAAALEPKDWRIADTLAIALLRKGLADEAIEVVGEARLTQPTNPTLRFRLADALAASGDPDQARRLLLEIGQTQFPERAEADALLSKLQAEQSDQ